MLNIGAIARRSVLISHTSAWILIHPFLILLSLLQTIATVVALTSVLIGGYFVQNVHGKSLVLSSLMQDISIQRFKVMHTRGAVFSGQSLSWLAYTCGSIFAIGKQSPTIFIRVGNCLRRCLIKLHVGWHSRHSLWNSICLPCSMSRLHLICLTSLA